LGCQGQREQLGKRKKKKSCRKRSRHSVRKKFHGSCVPACAVHGKGGETDREVPESKEEQTREEEMALLAVQVHATESGASQKREPGKK